MHCFRCKSLMTETDKQAAARSQVIWYQCPVCGQNQLHAQPTAAPEPDPAFHLGSATRRIYAGS